MGSSSPSTVTQTTSNVPFNASQLETVQNQALNLLNGTGLQYYPGATYAEPNANQNDALTGAANTGLSSGNALQGLLPGAQSSAVNQNTNITNGAAQNGISPYNMTLFSLGGSNPAASGMSNLSGIANGTQYNAVAPQIQALATLGTDSAAAQGLTGLSNGTAAQGLTGLGTGSSPTAQALQALTGGTAAQGLSGLGAGTGTAAQQLAATASGQYLGSNPYLDSVANAAAAPVVRAYQTATAPQTQSAFLAAGRSGSGADMNAQSVNQRNLGDALGNMDANIFGTDYSNERQLQNSAASTLGSLQNSAYNNLGSLQSGALGTLGGIQNSALSNLGGLQNSAYSNLGSLDQTALNNALSQIGNQFGIQSNAASNLGQLGVSGANSQEQALNAGVGNILNSYGIQQNAINSTPALTNQAYTDYQTALNAGTQQQANTQASLNDTENRFYGQEYAPYQTLDQVASVVGGAIPGLTSSQVPYFQPSGASQALGGLAAAGSLGSTLFGAPAAGGLVGALK